VQTVSLTWQHSGELAAVLAAVGGAMRLAPDRRVRAVGAFVRETAVIAVLYGLWQLAGELSVAGTHDAITRAQWIERVEHDVFLPSEASVQHLVLGHPLVVQGINLYYAAMHFPMMFVFLIWLFVRHRDRYRPVRTVLALTTLVCLLIQLIPVAPPRMLPGIVDTGLLYNQSVYNNSGFDADQLSAMPSVHVAWAVLVGYYTWRIGNGRWRYLGVAHAAITIFVVVATGNHWWLDGAVAIVLLGAVAAAQGVVRRLVHARRRPAEPVSVTASRPADVAAGAA
jgi:hypothetical protein